jgi:hypothetical protein
MFSAISHVFILTFSFHELVWFTDNKFMCVIVKIGPSSSHGFGSIWQRTGSRVDVKFGIHIVDTGNIPS